MEGILVSVKYLAAVWSDEKIKCQGTLLVALAIADYANDKGHCWPATHSLAFKARCSERTVQYAVSKLKQEGVLSVRTQAGPHYTNLYCLYPGGVQSLHRGVQSDCGDLHQGGANDGMGGVQNGVPSFAPDPSGTVIDPSLIRQIHKEGCKRLHGIPCNVDEVIAYGKSIRPMVTEETCRAFWGFYEGISQTNPSGDTFWVTSGGSVITKWKVKLPSFNGVDKRTPKPEANAIQEIIKIRDFNAPR